MNQVLKERIAHTSDQWWSEVLKKALAGDAKALEDLLAKLQVYIYNICLRMVLAPDDAEDLTQEVLLKVVLNLSKYDPTQSKITTWAYAILRNHVIDSKPKKLESVITSFDEYGKALDHIKSTDFDTTNPESQLLVKEANIGCMLGMLVCLDRDQRLIFILGEILKLDHKNGAEICQISPENFRKKLSRARSSLYEFMNNKCGLINKNNPCRCHRKTKGFIEAGWVNQEKLQFADEYYQNQRIFSEEKANEFCDFTKEYGDMFRHLPAYNSNKTLVNLKDILHSDRFKGMFKL